MNQGERIKSLRISLKLTQESLAARLGVTKVTVQRWESGAITNLKREKLLLLATALGTTPEYLLGVVENPNPRTLFSEDRLRFQWECEHPGEVFDRQAFEEYKKPVDRCHEEIINYIDELCLKASSRAKHSSKNTLLKGVIPTKNDPDYDEYMGNLADEMLDSLGLINKRRLDAIMGLLHKMEDIALLEIRLADEVDPAEH